MFGLLKALITSDEMLWTLGDVAAREMGCEEKKKWENKWMDGWNNAKWDKQGIKCCESGWKPRKSKGEIKERDCVYIKALHLSRRQKK